MKWADMLAQIRALGCTARRTGYDDEIRVNPYPGAPEEQAYYTHDREDAVNTARDMAARRDMRL